MTQQEKKLNHQDNMHGNEERQHEDAGQHGGMAPRRGYLQRWIPHPLLTLVLVLLWMALLNSFTAAGLIVGIILGMLIPIYTANFWPQRPVVRAPLQVLSFVAIVILDVVVANIQVAFLILFRRAERLRSRWVSIPLELTSPEAITVLVGTITLTPGTVASDLSSDGRTLLVHCLDVGDEEQLVRRIKQRYERRIGAILP